MIRQRRSIRSAALATVTAAAITAAVLPAFTASAAEGAVTPDRRDPAAVGKDSEHNFEGPFSKQQAEAREVAVERMLKGGPKAKTVEKNGSTVMKLDDGKYVELAREQTDKIFPILVEFGDKVDNETMYDPDGEGPEPAVVKWGGTPGPAHNTIAKPDRTKDNSTAWHPDFNREHFQDLYFSHDADKESVAKYYEKQSSGRYSVEGEVQDWVKVEYNEARYGGNWCGDNSCDVWDLVRDAVNKWTDEQKAAGKTAAEIKAALAEYDQWDRYDFDGDGNFNESDGYIDHFQIVHAGEDESAGGGAQGTDAIWAHRWYAFGTDVGSTGPADNKSGGTEIGDTGIWVGDYTIQPENGGLGVYAHEYGHDLGLPDHYDTTGGGENSTGFWTLMSSGSWLGEGNGSIGELPGDMSAWDKLQLGWLNYDVARAGEKSTHKLGVAEYNTDDAQALVTILPKKAVTTTIATPPEGTQQWWSGSGDNLSNTLTRSVDLTGKTSASLSFKGWYEIEEGYDYLYTEVSTDGGATFTPIDGTMNGTAIPRDGGDKPALDGTSGGYQDFAYPLDAYAGQNIQLRFRYYSDGGVAEKGFTADALKITADGAEVFADGAEGDDNGWTAKGFSRIGASFTKDYAQYYIAENRQYVSYDKTLEVGPYNFGFANSRPDWVEHYPYQNGLLISLWDRSQSDNNTSVHPGKGLILPVDAHAKPLRWSSKGGLMRSRIQSYDSTFSTYPTDALVLHKDSKATTIPSQSGVSVFDDRFGTYWYKVNPYAGVQVPNTGTRISITDEPLDGSSITVEVGPSVK
ncbi:immune inhibitor A domain-containing protein [Streptomyces polyrhachis]|uniref:Immune inhibitor A domain-containing protein n=1 Tax=Streptomyces polyrhachis TaxID=1282885 RepID=A0ABW2GCG8_9ACTN